MSLDRQTIQHHLRKTYLGVNLVVKKSSKSSSSNSSAEIWSGLLDSTLPVEGF